MVAHHAVPELRPQFLVAEQAARLQPAEFRPDGTRVKRVEPMTPEREEREEREARERRQQVLQELRDGTRSVNVAGDEQQQLDVQSLRPAP